MKIDFYVYDTTNMQRMYFAACSLLEKIYTEQSQSIFVNMNTREDAERFDALLWTYRDDSFIPHALYQAEALHPPRIQIGYTENIAPITKNILINFTPTIPPFYQQFEHVIEIVFADPLAQQSARERYKQYRDQGCLLNTIKLKVSTHD